MSNKLRVAIASAATICQFPAEGWLISDAIQHHNTGNIITAGILFATSGAIYASPLLHWSP